MSSARVPIFAGNWKMNLGLDEALALAKALADGSPVKESGSSREVWVFPPAPFALTVAQAVADSPLRVGVQNVHVGESGEQSGAYTGEWSPRMLRSAGFDLCLIGHSERRHVFGESDALLNRKLHGALAEELTVCFCVGELLEERQAGRTRELIASQLEKGLAGVSRDDLLRGVVLAYEPVWAIGTGQVATPAQAEEVHAFVRTWLDENVGAGSGASMRILYGGSVKPDNVVGLMALPDIDGA